jgi:hypothetical protein
MEPDPSLRFFEITGTGGFFCFGNGFFPTNGTGGSLTRKVGSLNKGIRGFFLSGWLGTRVPGAGGYSNRQIPAAQHHWKALPCSGAYTRASERARANVVVVVVGGGWQGGGDTTRCCTPTWVTSSNCLMPLPPGAEFKQMPAAVCNLLEIHIDRCAGGRIFLFLFLVHEARAQAYRESSPKEERIRRNLTAAQRTREIFANHWEGRKSIHR